jgi:hypothetical protein
VGQRTNSREYNRDGKVAKVLTREVGDANRLLTEPAQSAKISVMAIQKSYMKCPKCGSRFSLARDVCPNLDCNGGKLKLVESAFSRSKRGGRKTDDKISHK